MSDTILSSKEDLPRSLQKPNQQDALVMLVVFAARVGIAEDSDRTARKISRLFELSRQHPLFEESVQSILDRINLYVNFLAGGMPPKEIEQAVQVLPDGMRQDAYAWSVDLLGADISAIEISKSLETLRRMLGIEPAIALEHQRIAKQKQS